jgi:hypothetical protein
MRRRFPNVSIYVGRAVVSAGLWVSVLVIAFNEHKITGLVQSPTLLESHVRACLDALTRRRI